MAEWQHILIGGAKSRTVIETIVGDLTQAEGEPAEGGVKFEVADAAIGVFIAEYADEQQLSMEHYGWVVDVDGVAQTDWARVIFDAMSEQTDWSLLWQSNSVQIDARAGSAA